MSFGISLESKKFNLDLIKTLIKILFSSNFGMQISAKNWDYLNFFFKIQRNISFGISLESELFYLDLIKTLIKILFSSNFGMQISAKIWDYLKK